MSVRQAARLIPPENPPSPTVSVILAEASKTLSGRNTLLTLTKASVQLRETYRGHIFIPVLTPD